MGLILTGRLQQPGRSLADAACAGAGCGAAALEIVSSAEMICDLTLDLSKVVHDYLR